MPKTLTYTNDFDGNENISGSLTVTVRPGQGVDRSGLDARIGDSPQDFDDNDELILFAGKQVGGYAEFADERFDSVSGQPADAFATSFTLNTELDIIENLDQGVVGNGRIDGFSFNFGDTATLPPVGDGSSTPRQGALENGVSEGLAIRVKPLDDVMEIAWNGTIIGSVRSTTLESAAPGTFNVNVTEAGVVTANFAGATVTGQIPTVGGKPGLLAADQTGWGFSFAGRTGGNQGEVWVDNLSLTARVVCYTAGTLIDTATGPKPVETLQAGDLVVTRDHGLQPIRWINSWTADAAKLQQTPGLSPVKIAQGALGPDMPSQDLLVSGQHRILVASPIVQRMFNSDEVFVAAKHLQGLPGVTTVATGDSVTYYHFLCDAHEIVRANGAWAETLLIAPQMYQSLPWAAVTKIFQLFPQMQQRLDNPQPARDSLKAKDTAVMIERHVKNGKPLFAPDYDRDAATAMLAGQN